MFIPLKTSGSAFARCRRQEWKQEYLIGKYFGSSGAPSNEGQVRKTEVLRLTGTQEPRNKLHSASALDLQWCSFVGWEQQVRVIPAPSPAREAAISRLASVVRRRLTSTPAAFNRLVDCIALLAALASSF
jgi:hypothetical protein